MKACYCLLFRTLIHSFDSYRPIAIYKYSDSSDSSDSIASHTGYAEFIKEIFRDYLGFKFGRFVGVKLYIQCVPGHEALLQIFILLAYVLRITKRR